MSGDYEGAYVRRPARSAANDRDHYRRGRIGAGRLPAIAGRAVRLGRECLVHPEHADKVPIEPHYVRPRPRGGGDSQVLTLCANAHGRVHHLLDAIEGYASACPYATAGEVLTKLPAHVWTGFTHTEQMIAYRGWESYGLGFLNGRYLNAFRWWSTDGTAKADEVPHFDELFHATRWSRKWRKVLNEL